jgi:hypothetical protein
MELVSSSQPEDAVVRLQRFKAEHPAVSVMSPLDTKSIFWKGYAADGRQLTVQYDLGSFVSVLEVLAERDEL